MRPNDEMWFLRQIDDWAERAPARLAHVHRYGQLTYLDLKRRSDGLACFLLQALPGTASLLLEHFWAYLRTNDVSGYFDGVREKIGRELLWPLLQGVATVEDLSTEVWRATGSSLEH